MEINLLKTMKMNLSLQAKKTFFWMSLFSLIALLGFSIEHEMFMRSAQKAEGVVIENVSKISDGSESFSPKYEYSVNGKTYTRTSNASSYPPSYNIGETVEVFYNPNKPEAGRINLFKMLGVIFFVVLPFFFIGMIPYLYYLWQVNQQQKNKIILKQIGTKVEATVNDVFVINENAKKGRFPWKIIAETKFNGQKSIFTSENLYSKPNKNIGDKVFVLIDPNNPKKYFIEV